LRQGDTPIDLVDAAGVGAAGAGTPGKPRPAFVPRLPLSEKGIEGQFGKQ
jgi:hypothetical protein